MPAYTPTTWVDGVTPVNAANLNKIEAELVDTDTTLGSYLPIDSVVAAATRLQANKLLAGDSQPAFRSLGSGKHEWGPGGSTAPDTNLYRSGAGVLTTDGQLVAKGGVGFVYNPAAAAGVALWFQVGADTQPRFNITYDGVMSWGQGGSTGVDTSLYRSGTNALRTGGALAVDGVSSSAAGFSCNANTGSVWPLVHQVQGEAQRRFQITNTGQVGWGPGGSTAVDLTLERNTTWGGAALLTLSRFAATGVMCRPGLSAGGWNSNAFNIEWTGTPQLWIDATNLGSFTMSSDARYKHMIAPLASTWETVKALAPVSYRWRNAGIFVDDGMDHVGFIAQDVQKAIPSGASGGTEGKAESEQPMSLNLADIVSTMCKALQEAQLRIEALEAVA